MSHNHTSHTIQILIFLGDLDKLICSSYGEEKQFIQDFGREPLKKQPLGKPRSRLEEGKGKK